MHCDSCGAKLDVLTRCAGCRKITSGAWLLMSGMLVWIVCLALYVATRLLYADIAVPMAALGAEPPLPSRLFFRLSDVGLAFVGGLALVAPIAICALSRGRNERLERWPRAYVVATLVGVFWVALGFGAWYLSAVDNISPLR
jgi:hypothetical protein